MDKVIILKEATKVRDDEGNLLIGVGDYIETENLLGEKHRGIIKEMDSNVAIFDTPDGEICVECKNKIIILKRADNLYPLENDQNIDMFNKEPKDKPFRQKHRRRFRNEPDGLQELNWDGMGGRQDFTGQGTDKSYDTGTSSGQAIGY